MLFSRGMRDKLSKYVDCNKQIKVCMSITGNSVYDYCCFGVDNKGKLSDDRYMVFYNQTSSPMNEISYSCNNNSAEFVIDLSRLPQTIDKLVFTASIDGSGTMGQIQKHSFSVQQLGQEKISMSLTGNDFKSEKAIISAEIYRKDEWRIAAVANGFNGGLSALLESYGGTEIKNAPQPPVPQQQAPSFNNPSAYNNNPSPVPQQQAPSFNSTSAYNNSPQTAPGTGKISLQKTEEELTKEVMGKISLSKDKDKLGSHVVNLSKCVVSLSKKNGVDLGSTRAKVVVALDYSGSMYSLYNNGTVQNTINRLVPLGLTFDDNGTIDVYLFQSDYRKISDLNLSNYEYYVKQVVNTCGYKMGGTNYSPVLRAIIEGGTYKQGGFLGFGGTSYRTDPIVDNGDPTFILFITDGANSDCGATDNIIRQSSAKNVFIQFIGIGSENFNYLRKLDEMEGRERNNTGFTKMQDLDGASDNELYTNVLEQFSSWLRGTQ